MHGTGAGAVDDHSGVFSRDDYPSRVYEGGSPGRQLQLCCVQEKLWIKFMHNYYVEDISTCKSNFLAHFVTLG